MRHLLGVGTNRGHTAMIGLGLGLGVSGFRLPTLGWNPTRISGLKWWLDAGDPNTLHQSAGGADAVADGDPVGEWLDKSGNGYHPVQASGTNKPALKLNIKNGLSVVRFDGVNDGMPVASSTASFKFLHSQDSTVFVVFKFNALGAAPVIFDTCDGNGANIGSLLLATSSGTIGMRAARTGGTYCFNNASSTSYIAASSWYVTCFKNNPSNATVGLRSYGYKNAGSAFNNNTESGALSTSNATYDMMLGRAASTSSNFASIDIAEIIMYDSALSDANRAEVDAYLNGKWGIY